MAKSKHNSRLMKKIIFILLLFAAKAQAQTDTTIVTGFSLSARLMEYLAPSLANPGNEENFDTFLKWRKAFRVNNPPSGNTTVITDTVSVSTLVYLYNTVLQNQDGFGISSSFKAAIIVPRNTNANLNRQLNDIDALFANQVTAMRSGGRRLLTGKNQ